MDTRADDEQSHFASTRADDEQSHFASTRADDEALRCTIRCDDEAFSFRNQGIGADQCALSF